MKENILKAKNMAIFFHGNQKYGENNYIYHLELVYDLLNELNYSDDYLIAAFLHDSFEDTQINKDEVKRIFGIFVYDLINSVSGFGNNRKEKKQDIINKLNIFEPAIDLKMADRIINIRQAIKDGNDKLYKMYLSEKNDYDIIFKRGNPKLFIMLSKLFENNLLEKKQLKIK